MGNIEEGWEPFEVQVTIDGELRPLLVVPDQEEAKYQVFEVSCGRILGKPVRYGVEKVLL